MSILGQIKEVLIEQLELSDDEIHEDSTFVELGADSIDMVEISMSFEDMFHIEIPDSELKKLKTISDAIHYLEEKTRK